MQRDKIHKTSTAKRSSTCQNGIHFLSSVFPSASMSATYQQIPLHVCSGSYPSIPPAEQLSKGALNFVSIPVVPPPPSFASSSVSTCARLPSPSEKQQQQQPPLSSVNKSLICRLHVPVCLCVCLTRQQLSRRSGVAVSQVLVSVLLSIHLPVTVSQIRRVNLPPAFPPPPR